MEETGLKIAKIKFDGVYNVIWPEENYHYIDIAMRGEIVREYKAEPENTEPDKCEGRDACWTPSTIKPVVKKTERIASDRDIRKIMAYCAVFRMGMAQLESSA